MSSQLLDSFFLICIHIYLSKLWMVTVVTEYPHPSLVLDLDD